MHTLRIEPTFSAWREQARKAWAAGWLPEQLVWEEAGGQASLFAESPPPASGSVHNVHAVHAVHNVHRVPKAFLAEAKRVAAHRDPERWALLYRVLWRLTHGEPHLLAVAVDPDRHRLARWDKEVRRDVHKMRAFVRFREVAESEPRWYVAWFEPQHRILELNAGFFLDRFSAMRWSILTPDACAHWDGQALTFGPGLPRSAAPREDQTEDLWRTYYASIFNPARLKLNAMRAEMPKRYWKNLPEAELIAPLTRAAGERVARMMDC